MLKFILPLILLIKFRKEWKTVQVGLFFLGFLVRVSCYHNLL